MSPTNLKHKSKSGDLHRPNTTFYYPAGEASPVSIDGSELLLVTAQMQPRPRSSWYSQGSVDYGPLESGRYVGSSIPPPIPSHDQSHHLLTLPLMMTALHSSDAAARRSTGQSIDDKGESPRGPAVSDNLYDPVWMPPMSALEYSPPPMPISETPSVPSLLSSLSSCLSFSSNRPLTRRGSRQSSARRRSSGTPLPLAVNEVGIGKELAPSTSLSRTRKAPTPSLTFSSPWITPQRSTVAQSPATPHKQLIVTPNEQSYQSPSPIPPTSSSIVEAAKAKQWTLGSATNSSVARGLSLRYRCNHATGPVTLPSHTGPQVHAQRPKRPVINAQPLPSSTSTQTPPTTQAYEPTLSQYPYHFYLLRTSNPAYRPLHNLQFASILDLQQNWILYDSERTFTLPRHPTRDPAQCSDQGSWLFIGTMRGPNPEGVRLVDEIMRRAEQEHIEKGSGGKGWLRRRDRNRGGERSTGEAYAKGAKEIRKMLRYERRGVIEWIAWYLETKWCVQV